MWWWLLLFFPCPENVWLLQCWRRHCPYPLLRFWKRSPYSLQHFQYLSFKKRLEVRCSGPPLFCHLTSCCPQELSCASRFQMRDLSILLPLCHFPVGQELSPGHGFHWTFWFPSGLIFSRLKPRRKQSWAVGLKYSKACCRAVQMWVKSWFARRSCCHSYWRPCWGAVHVFKC